MTPQTGTPAGRLDWLQAAIVATGLFLLYAATSPRSVALEDDGLFVLSSYFLGIEHPPGYPLFTLLGKLSTLLPVGSVAYRVHLLSAFFGALTCALLWMCTRQLVAGRAAAYLAALGFGFSRTFWSQAIIAEVYTLNTFFFFLLLYLCLRAVPRAGETAARGALPAIALVSGLSLANHWPLMGLAAPGLAVLLWPRSKEMLRRWLPLTALLLLGLTPYAWLVARSWEPLPISFYGPLESWKEVWFMLSRSGYAAADVSPTAGWLDRSKFFAFFGSELLLQFAIAGSLLAVLGFWAQWRVWERRTAWGLTLAFLGPSAVLLLLLGFDYDAVHKHLFHVYPLPAYGIAALWMALGGAWLARRVRLRPALEGAACAVLSGLILASGWQWISRSGIEWTEAYVRAVLESVPRDAILVARGDSDLIPIAYFHMVEGWRPDLTLVQPSGLILGNRLLHPLRVAEDRMKEFVIGSIGAEERVVATTLFAEVYLADQPRRDHWLVQVVDRTPGSPRKVIEIPEPALRFLEESVLGQRAGNPWLATLQGELRQRYARLLAMQLQRGQAPDARTARHLNALAADFFGALGLIEGLLSNERGYDAARAIALLDQVRLSMPPDAGKREQARYFELRAYLRQGQRDEHGAIEDLQTAVSLWPARDNGAVTPLKDHYIKAGEAAALDALRARLKR